MTPQPERTASEAPDVVAIGNALVDVLGQVEPEVLERHGLTAGSMSLVFSSEDIAALEASLGATTEMSGGTAANTLAGLASFGGRASFIGRVADDELGRIYAHDLGEAGVRFAAEPAGGGEPTGRCVVFITPDGQRTMNTFLGASSQLSADLVDDDVVASAAVTYLEGYLFDQEPAKAAFRRAAEIAHGAGRRVALTLSDGFCVDRHRDDFADLVASGVDILFANEDEITRLYETDDFETALKRVGDNCEIACLTCSERGSVVLAGGERHDIAAEPVTKVVDTTGAGDLYAAGFLHGLTNGEAIEECGRRGSVAAAAVLGHVGARPGLSLAQLLG